uniref:Uncharacterized protein n=1 Tax=Siphoviridae sp. ctcK97 TaxID=2825571 RepID=A0A8S5UAU5_9CAUD|nr:MAG TPA: hypothetical protein [Siphoviridae sp. ctcK97]
MTQINDNMKTYLKNPGAQFNREPNSEKVINSGILALAKRAVGNAIADDEPYTIRINFQNGRVVGSEAEPRLSVELLDGRASTPEIDVPKDITTVFLELKALAAEGHQSILNGDSWVARVKLEGDTVKTVFVSRDFSEEDRELIKAALLRGFRSQVGM